MRARDTVLCKISGGTRVRTIFSVRKDFLKQNAEFQFDFLPKWFHNFCQFNIEHKFYVTL